MGIELLDWKGGSFLGNDCKNFPDGGGKKGGGGGRRPGGGCGGGGGGGNEGGDGGGDKLLLLSSSSFGSDLSFNLLSLFFEIIVKYWWSGCLFHEFTSNIFFINI